LLHTFDNICRILSQHHAPSNKRRRILSIKPIAASVPLQSKLPSRRTRDLAAPHSEI